MTKKSEIPLKRKVTDFDKQKETIEAAENPQF